MSLLPANFGSRRPGNDDAAPRLEPEPDTRHDVFNLIPPRVEEFERPTFERPYGLNRPVDLDLVRLEAVQKQREAALVQPQETDAQSAFEDPPPADVPLAEPALASEPQPDAAWQEEPAPAATWVSAPLTVAEPPPAAEPVAMEPAAPLPAPQPARGVGPAGMDLTRLSIDEDGRLYWDGKPVEVRRRVTMSRPQIFGASVIGLLVFVAALGAAIQAATAVHAWGCRTGLIESHCTTPASTRFDFPA